MLVAQVIDPGSKLATARGLRTETATSSLGELLAFPAVTRTTCMRPWTGCWPVKEAIENALGRPAFGQRHAGAL